MNLFYDNKQYKSIKILNNNDYNTRKLYLDVLFTNKLKTIIKITKINKDNIILFNKIKIISELLYNHTEGTFGKNFINIKHIFIYHDLILFNDIIFDFTKNNNYKYICELRDYYKFDSLNNYLNRFTLNELKDILLQLILAQLNVFYLYGFVHNNISLDNIFYEDIEDEITISYKFYYYSAQRYNNKKNI